MDRFKNTTFHRENQPTPKPKPKPKLKGYLTPTKEEARSDFIKELVQTGKANWKIAPSDLKRRYNGIYMILLAIPVVLVTSVELYRRLEGKSTKKIQQGEILDNGEVRKFDELEKYKVEKQSWSYRLFGKDFFLDGFTSKTMKDESKEK